MRRHEASVGVVSLACAVGIPIISPSRDPAAECGFDRERFLRLLAGKDADWIREASRTILSCYSRPGAEALPEMAGNAGDARSAEHCRVVVGAMASPAIGIAMGYGKCSYDKPWRPKAASAALRPGAEPPPPAAAGHLRGMPCSARRPVRPRCKRDSTAAMRLLMPTPNRLPLEMRTCAPPDAAAAPSLQDSITRPCFQYTP